MDGKETVFKYPVPSNSIYQGTYGAATKIFDRESSRNGNRTGPQEGIDACLRNILLSSLYTKTYRLK